MEDVAKNNKEVTKNNKEDMQKTLSKNSSKNSFWKKLKIVTQKEGVDAPNLSFSVLLIK